MLPGHHLSGTKILKNERARKIIRIFSNFLMRETINAISSVARVRLAAVAKEKVYLLAFFFFARHCFHFSPIYFKICG